MHHVSRITRATFFEIAVSEKYTVNQGCITLPTYYLKEAWHLARPQRRRRRCRLAYGPASNTASHGNHEKFPLVSYIGMGLRLAALRGPGVLL